MQPNQPQQGPQGHPQGPQQWGPQGHPQGPQQGPPQQYPQQGYQMGPPQYYPPQKKGMPGWAIALIVGAVFMFVVLPILALAAIPLITTNTSDARRAEGEQLMFSARNRARLAFARNSEIPVSFTAAGVPRDMLEGHYYRVDDRIGGTSTQGEITCSPVQSPADGHGRLSFNWTDGGGEQVHWGN